MTMPPLRETFGDIDIYLFDQLLRGRIAPGMCVVDAGCGAGRNLRYFLRHGYEVYAADGDERAVAAVRQLATEFVPGTDVTRFRVEPIEAMSFPEACGDVVISSAVLHFARNPDHFDRMLRGTWRVLRPGGLFFCRLASTIGIETQVRPVGDGRFHLPDGSERYLVDEPALLAATTSLRASLADPLKTTIVHGQRSMTTWVLWKH